ncbi:hypothetical protein ABD05_15670 [Burkholderia pyrrocinia]|nr:hypothetical protein ABD05_15670 [Burkholderia pyrrocinia]GAU01430.1 hypothetical protein BSLA_01r2864 [Burkholderia stabilis]
MQLRDHDKQFISTISELQVVVAFGHNANRLKSHAPIYWIADDRPERKLVTFLRKGLKGACHMRQFVFNRYVAIIHAYPCSFF